MSTTAKERCPWCGSTISHAHFSQIEKRIRVEEQNRLRRAEADLKSRLQKQFEVRAQQVNQRAQTDAARRLASVEQQKDKLMEHCQELQARETSLRESLQEDARRLGKKE